MWSDANVKAELDAMKSWGVNCIRCHFSIELWKYDIGPDSGHPASPYCSISARDALKRLAQFAAERDMYVIYDAYSVKCYWSGCDQDPLPFPPYSTSQDASSIIANTAEFADFWRSVASELKDYSNVIFEIWNEPCNRMSVSNKTHEEAFIDWMDAWNLCVNAIREEGATQPVIFQWAMGVYCNLYDDPETGEIYATGGTSGSLRLQHWLEDAVGYLTDPLNSIIYSTHVYRVYGGTGLYKFGAREIYGDYGWVYEHIKSAFEYMGFKWAQETMNVPLFIGEVGCDLAFTDEEYIREIAAWNNTLSLFDEWEIHYTAFWWRQSGLFRLHEGPPDFTPTDSGEILKEKLLGITPTFQHPKFEELAFSNNTRLKSELKPYIIPKQVSEEASTSVTTVTFTNNTLKVELEGTGTDSISIWCGSFGEPYNVKGATNWIYSEEERVLNVTIQFHSPLTLEIEWLTSGTQTEPPILPPSEPPSDVTPSTPVFNWWFIIFGFILLIGGILTERRK